MALSPRSKSRRTPAPVEVVLWMLPNGDRIAQAFATSHPVGRELRFLVNGDLLWSEVFKAGRGVVLGELAETKRGYFEGLGWTRADV